jgi:hypothetical protein
VWNLPIKEGRKKLSPDFECYIYKKTPPRYCTKELKRRKCCIEVEEKECGSRKSGKYR